MNKQKDGKTHEREALCRRSCGIRTDRRKADDFSSFFPTFVHTKIPHLFSNTRIRVRNGRYKSNYRIKNITLFIRKIIERYPVFFSCILIKRRELENLFRPTSFVKFGHPSSPEWPICYSHKMRLFSIEDTYTVEKLVEYRVNDTLIDDWKCR